MKPMVSVIVPVYNAEQTIRRCVASILDQQFTDLELLLVDDGSTDGSGAICDEFAARDARVTAIHQKNAGVSAARNHALDLAQGVYLQFLDSDDWITPDATRSPGGRRASLPKGRHRRGQPPHPGGIRRPHDGKSSGLLLRRPVE